MASINVHPTPANQCTQYTIDSYGALNLCKCIFHSYHHAAMFLCAVNKYLLATTVARCGCLRLHAAYLYRDQLVTLYMLCSLCKACLEATDRKEVALLAEAATSPSGKVLFRYSRSHSKGVGLKTEIKLRSDGTSAVLFYFSFNVLLETMSSLYFISFMCAAPPAWANWPTVF